TAPFPPKNRACDFHRTRLKLLQADLTSRQHQRGANITHLTHCIATLLCTLDYESKRDNLDEVKHGYLCDQTRHQHALRCDDRASHFALIFRHHSKHINPVVWQIATRPLCGSAVYAA